MTNKGKIFRVENLKKVEIEQTIYPALRLVASSYLAVPNSYLKNDNQRHFVTVVSSNSKIVFYRIVPKAEDPEADRLKTIKILTTSQMLISLSVSYIKI